MIKYKNKMLNVLQEWSVTPETFKMSNPEKISKKRDRAFSLPAGPDFACPGSTKACEGCYATKGRHLFGNVQKAFASNFVLFKHYERSGDEVGCALELSKHMPAEGIFRIHESGDFFSQFAVNVWSLVVANNPNVDFYAYTRSFDFDYNALLGLDNFRLWASTDDYNLNRAEEFVDLNKEYGVRHAHGPWKHDKQIPEDSFICPATSGKIQMSGACDRCKLCVLKHTMKNVVFLEH